MGLSLSEKQSDGIVLAESAANMAGATVNENTPGYTKDDFVLYGSIHMQMRNDMNMKRKLEGVKTGDEWYGGLYHGYYGLHFKID